jgi:hypothetical protein
VQSCHRSRIGVERRRGDVCDEVFVKASLMAERVSNGARAGGNMGVLRMNGENVPRVGVDIVERIAASATTCCESRPSSGSKCSN